MSDKTKIEVINRLRGIAIGVATTAMSLSISPVNAQENTVKNNNINNNITLTEDVHSSVNDSATVDFMEALDSVDTNAYNSNLDNTKIGKLESVKKKTSRFAGIVKPLKRILARKRKKDWGQN